MAKLASAVDTQGKEFRANAAAMRALVQELAEQARRSRARRPAALARAPHRARQIAAARARAAADRSRHAVSRIVAARRQRHVRGRDPRRRHHHRHRPHRGPRVRHRVQRRHHQGRHLLSDDREEAPARAGDRAREPAALHLSGRLRRREPAAMAGGVSGPRALRPHLLQSGDAVLARHSADRLRDGLMHGGRRLRAGDVGRGDHRAQTGHDLPRRPAAGEGRDRRGGVGGGSRRRGRARAALRRRRPLRGGRRSRARDRCGASFRISIRRRRSTSTLHAAARAAVRCGRARRHRAERHAPPIRHPRDHRAARRCAPSSTSSSTSTARRW